MHLPSSSDDPMRSLSNGSLYLFFFFFNDTATTEIYTLSPTRRSSDLDFWRLSGITRDVYLYARPRTHIRDRSEEHTSELQSQSNIVCRLLPDKKTTQHARGTSLQRARTIASTRGAGETD